MTMSSWGRSGVADVAEVSRDVAVVSPQCRGVSRRRREMSPRCRRGVAGCRGGVAGCRRCRGVLPSVKSLSPAKVTQQSNQKVWFEQFGSGMECRRDVAAISQGVADVARCRRCRGGVTAMSRQCRQMSRWCRQMSQRCRDGVARCRGGVAVASRVSRSCHSLST